MELEELIGKVDDLIEEAKCEDMVHERNEAREDLRAIKKLLDDEFRND